MLLLRSGDELLVVRVGDFLFGGFLGSAVPLSDGGRSIGVLKLLRV